MSVATAEQFRIEEMYGSQASVERADPAVAHELSDEISNSRVAEGVSLNAPLRRP